LSFIYGVLTPLH